jgi:hypothetical protein
MSLRSWLPRRFSRFFRWAWVGRAPLWRLASLDRPAGRDRRRWDRRDARRSHGAIHDAMSWFRPSFGGL